MLDAVLKSPQRSVVAGSTGGADTFETGGGKSKSSRISELPAVLDFSTGGGVT